MSMVNAVCDRRPGKLLNGIENQEMNHISCNKAGALK
jgi:hypothetical protein